MNAFYCTQSSATTKINRIGRITFNMLGSAKVPMLKAKAMETHCLVPLMLELLLEHSGKFGRRFLPLQTCVVSLLRFFAVCKREPRAMSTSGIDAVQKAMCVF